MISLNNIRVKFLVPIIALQLIALGSLGMIGYRFSSDMLKRQSEGNFKTTIDEVHASLESELSMRLERISQLVNDPVFIKFSAAPQYKSDADLELFNFQKGNGLVLGEPEVGGLVNFPIGLQAGEGNKMVMDEGLFPAIEYVGLDGFVKMHVYAGGSNDRDFEMADRSKLDRNGEGWFEAAKGGKISISSPRIIKLYLKEYQPITFENEERVKEEELLAIAIPHRVGNSINGVFLVATSADFISKAAGRAPGQSLLMILDSDGVEIVKRGDTKIDDDLTPDLITRSSTFPQDTIIDDGNHLVMYKQIASAGWSIFIIDDRSDIYVGIGQLRNNIVMIIFFSVALMGFFIFMIVRGLLAPVLKLTRASQRIAAGELGIVIARESDDEIGTLIDSFSRMSQSTKEMHDILEDQNRRLLRMNFIRRQLLKIISHELRTPLNSVVGFYELMQLSVDGGFDKLDDKEFLELFSGLGDGIARCKLLVERLTRASSVMAEGIKAADIDESCNVIEVLPIVCEEAIRHAKVRGIVVSYPKSISVSVSASVRAVQLLLEEALANAIKYSPDFGVVDVEVTEVGDSIEIAVSDRGPGIAPEYLKDVVEPFFEIQDADKHSSGSYASGKSGLGLGLTIIISVLREAGGSLSIDKREGGGTRVAMIIPKGR